jgi:hypothetical protein
MQPSKARGTFDEIAVRLDVGIALPFVDEHVSRDDHHRPGLPVAFLPLRVVGHPGA